MVTPVPRKEISYYDPTTIDFASLAQHDEIFARLLAGAQRRGGDSSSSNSSSFIDFQDPALLHQLTRTLLSQHFDGLVLPSLPPSRLCPPVPVRWNYVKWIQDLLDCASSSSSFPPTSSDGEASRGREVEVRGVDVGTGASAIYAILACGARENWKVVGTEVDGLSAESARRNLEANVGRLGGRARVVEVDGDVLLPFGEFGFGDGRDDDDDGVTVDFVMTNPPFYHSAEEMRASYVGKEAAPSAVCTGSENEMICPGGDVGFVTRLLEESLRSGARVGWYSAMMGKLSSLMEIVARLKEAGVRNWAVCCLQAGRRTKRWAVAWSFRDRRPLNGVARMGQVPHAVLPPATEQTIRVEGMRDSEAGGRVDAVLRELDVRWLWRATEGQGSMWARENVWSRIARRRKQFGGGDGNLLQSSKEKEGEGNGAVALAVRITCKDGQVDVRWLRGLDQLLFTSFCGMLKRTLIGHG